jgi:hypothetical protein
MKFTEGRYEKERPIPTYRPDMEETPAGGLRFDTGKNRLDLIPPEWEWALGQVMTKGAEKYAPRNWEKGMDWSKVVGPMRRHIVKFLAGERYDAEIGCHHLAMVAWNALALMSYDIRGIGINDVMIGDMTWLDRCKDNSASGQVALTETTSIPSPATK